MQDANMREVYTIYYVAPQRDPCDGYPSDFTYSIDSSDNKVVKFTSSGSGNYVNTLLLGWSRKWYFGTDSSDLQDPVFTFPEEGVFPVTLKYYNAAGCTEEITKNVSTYPLDYCNFSSSFTILKDTVQKGKVYFTGTTTPQFDNLKYKWSFEMAHCPILQKILFICIIQVNLMFVSKSPGKNNA